MASTLFDTSEAPVLDTDQSPYKRVEALIPADSPLHGITSLEELGEWLASNVLVPIDETRLNPVLGAGNPNADLMVIGEAPGAEEDKRGEAFVGRAGKLLDQILEAIGFSREENVYICNILKSRPPNNRDPFPGEIEACSHYLDAQIEAIRPRIIVPLGRHALSRWFPNESIGRLRAKPRRFGDVTLFPLYHPAAALHNGGLRATIEEDFAKLGTLLGGLKAPPAEPAAPAAEADCCAGARPPDA
ncbi:MAG: uracil-DNA glycosylase [Bacteroidetes bacterium]|nr:uracil-DNA glycosylase [Bacteroidota bacterium]